MYSSKRVQLIIAVSALFVVAGLLLILFVAILGQSEPTQSLAATPTVVHSDPVQVPVDRWAQREGDALRKVFRRPGAPDPDDETAERRRVQQVVESDLLSRAFPNLRWHRIERVGWQAFQLEGSVYEAQFVLRDEGVEFGPAWIVQLDIDGPQPPGSNGVVPANVFAKVVEDGVSEELEPYLGRESEVVEALTSHQFGDGVRLASAILVYFSSEGRSAADERRVVGWTVYGDRIDPSQSFALYRAAFQWEEAGRHRFAQWEINPETGEFRSLNILASDIMAAGDVIDPDELVPVLPSTLDLSVDPRRQPARVRALRAVIDNDRVTEALAALLWYRSLGGRFRMDARAAQRDGCNTACPASRSLTPMDGAEVVFTAVDFEADTAVLRNVSGDPLDLTDWEICRQASACSRVSSTEPLADGETLAVDLSGIPGGVEASDSLSLMGASNDIKAFVQWRSPEVSERTGRLTLAQDAGLWSDEPNDYVELCDGVPGLVAVGDLTTGLGFRPVEHPLSCLPTEYLHWEIDEVEGQRNTYDVAYLYRESGQERRIEWQVDLGSGEVRPRSELADLTRIATAYVEPSWTPPEPETTGGEETAGDQGQAAAGDEGGATSGDPGEGTGTAGEGTGTAGEGAGPAGELGASPESVEPSPASDAQAPGPESSDDDN